MWNRLGVGWHPVQIYAISEVAAHLLAPSCAPTAAGLLGLQIVATSYNYIFQVSLGCPAPCCSSSAIAETRSSSSLALLVAAPARPPERRNTCPRHPRSRRVAHASRHLHLVACFCPTRERVPTVLSALVVARRAPLDAAARDPAAPAPDASRAPPALPIPTPLIDAVARIPTIISSVVARPPTRLVSRASPGSKARVSADAENAPRSLTGSRSRAGRRAAHPRRMPGARGVRRVAHVGAGKCAHAVLLVTALAPAGSGPPRATAGSPFLVLHALPRVVAAGRHAHSTAAPLLAEARREERVTRDGPWTIPAAGIPRRREAYAIDRARACGV
ncbi:hypothetical protein EV121DRAFT_291234 [Schizophyllum commune]